MLGSSSNGNQITFLWHELDVAWNYRIRNERSVRAADFVVRQHRCDTRKIYESKSAKRDRLHLVARAKYCGVRLGYLVRPAASSQHSHRSLHTQNDSSDHRLCRDRGNIHCVISIRFPSSSIFFPPLFCC